MTERTLNEVFQESGEWFLPGSSKIISGTLSWESQKAYLSLHDSFAPMSGAIHSDTQTFSIIQGATTTSNYFTIFQAMRVNAGFRIGAAGLRQADKLLSTFIISGAHVNEDTLYSEVSFRIPGLQIWISRASVTQTFIEGTDDSPSAFNYFIQSLPEETFYVPSIETTLGWGIERSFSGDLITDINVLTKAHLRIKPDKPKPLDWYISQMGKASTLLSFLSASPMSPDYIQATLEDGSRKVDVLIGLRESKCCIHNHIFDFYMLRSGMDTDFAGVFIKWYEIYESIAMPSQLALSIFSSEKLWLHVEFLSLMQALEGLHRATMSEKISLRKRLNELVSRLDVTLRRFILGGDGSLPSSWVGTRNYYTHWDESSKASILDGYGMHKANVRMKHLLRALYLDLVGIPQSAINRALQNSSSESQYLIQLNNMEHHERNPQDDSGAFMHIGVSTTEKPKEK